jgi:hypothetical protein
MREHEAQLSELSQLNTEYLQTFGFPKPKFHPREQLPDIKEGEVLAKFYGAPVVLPARNDNEPVNAAGYTEFQQTIINYYDVVRRREGIEALRTMQDSSYEMKVKEVILLDASGEMRSV